MMELLPTAEAVQRCEADQKISPVDCLPDDRMHCVKLLGKRLSARDFDRQVAEVQVRVAVPNRSTALVTPITEAKE